MPRRFRDSVWGTDREELHALHGAYATARQQFMARVPADWEPSAIEQLAALAGQGELSERVKLWSECKRTSKAILDLAMRGLSDSIPLCNGKIDGGQA